jgi:hypothetical protein
MSRQSTFYPEGRWYKGNTHAHSNLSPDAYLSPAELVRVYKKKGYDFLAITDHWVYGIHQELTNADFLVLPGIELDVKAPAAEGRTHHLVGLGLPGACNLAQGQKIEHPDDMPVNHLVKLLAGLGNLVIYAHPAWSHTRHEVLASINGIFGMEIFNYLTEISHVNGFADTYYDRLLWQGRRVWCLACDDTHQQPFCPYDYGGGFIMVKSAGLTHPAIIQALLAGSFYASQGPLIEDYYLEDGQVHFCCSPCRTICFYHDINYGYAINDDAAGLTSGVYHLKGGESFVRAFCIDAAGKRAWTQPLWLK